MMTSSSFWTCAQWPCGQRARSLFINRVMKEKLEVGSGNRHVGLSEFLCSHLFLSSSLSGSLIQSVSHLLSALSCAFLHLLEDMAAITPNIAAASDHSGPEWITEGWVWVLPDATSRAWSLVTKKVSALFSLRRKESFIRRSMFNCNVNRDVRDVLTCLGQAGFHPPVGPWRSWRGVCSARCEAAGWWPFGSTRPGCSSWFLLTSRFPTTTEELRTETVCVFGVMFAITTGN